MRTSMVLASLLLLLLATRIHGIRLDKQFREAINKKEMVNSKGQPSDVANVMDKHCTSGGDCSGNKVRKPLVHTTLGAPKQSTERNNDTAVEAVQGRHGSEVTSAAAAAAASARVPKQQTQAYPDMLDVAGMDYSPATRKPPIHN